MANARLKFNAKLSSRTSSIPGEEKDVCLRATRPIKKGEELTTDYNSAHKTPFHMFVDYGFALSEDEHAKGSIECGGLGPDSDVHQCQNPIACKMSNFSKAHCTERHLREMHRAARENSEEL